jgi:hypothetical protein
VTRGRRIYRRAPSAHPFRPIAEDRLRAICRLLFAAAITSPLTARFVAGQGVQSAARAITLIAIKPPTPFVDMIEVRDAASKVDASGVTETTATIDVRENAACAVDIETAHADSTVDMTVGLDGHAHSLPSGRRVRVFDGWCGGTPRAGHAIDLFSHSAAAAVGDSLEVWVHVVTGRGEMARYWSARLGLPHIPGQPRK